MLDGPYSAIFTPMDSHGRVNFELLNQIADFQLGYGIQGFFACGSTGEGLLLSEEERTEVTQRLVNHVAGRGKVIAHVGHPSTDVAERLARKAADSGADWIASIAPIFYGTSREGAIRHYTQIAKATDLPFMIYSLGGVIDPRQDVELFKIPNVRGLKYTGSNFFSVQQLDRFLDQPVSLMSGFDEQFVAALSFGFHGGIGSTYNFAPQFYSEIFELYRSGNIEQAAQRQADINRVTELMVRYENWSYRKAIMKYIGYDCGSFRPPFTPLTPDEYAAFADELDRLGVLTRND